MAEGKTKDCDYYQTYLPPPQLGKWDGFKQFLWNPERKEFLGRTGSSWFKVTVFYIIFYICLAAFFAIMLVIFYQTLDFHQPKWIMGSSLIGTNPGLGFRPMPEKNVESTLIWFKRNSESNYKHWVDSLDKFLQPYDDLKQFGDTFKNCSQNNPSSNTKVCNFRKTDLGNSCTKENSFGYAQSSPCVVIKMNKIWGWSPEPFLPTDELPADMPKTLQDQIKNSTAANNTKVWVSCEGENPADKENIGDLNYWPYQGFDTYYFPYLNTPGYLAPLVAIQFKNLSPGILVNVQCKAWAKNIKHAKMERRGSVHFEMLMD